MPDKIYAQKKEPHLLFLFSEDHLGNIGNDGSASSGVKKSRDFLRGILGAVMSCQIVYCTTADVHRWGGKFIFLENRKVPSVGPMVHRTMDIHCPRDSYLI